MKTNKDTQDDKLHINVEDFINSTAESLGISDKEYMEELYLKGTGLKREHGEVVWENGKIVGFRPYKPCEYVSFTITVDKDKVNLNLD